MTISLLSPASIPPTTTNTGKGSSDRRTNDSVSCADHEQDGNHSGTDCDGCWSRSVETVSTKDSSSSSISFRGEKDTTSRQRSATPSILRTSSIGNSKINRSSSSSSSKRPLHVSFAETIATVHIVDNLKLSLTRKERKRIWCSPPDMMLLTELFYDDVDDEVNSMESRLGNLFRCISPRGDSSSSSSRSKHQKDEDNNKDKHCQRRKNNACDKKDREPKTPKNSPLRSITLRLGIRGNKRLKKIAGIPFRSND